MNQLGGGGAWSKPPGLVCHICGREYGTTSLQIHLPQCAAMWKARQKLLPRSERRPLPKATQSLQEMQSMRVDAKDADAMDRFNRQQMDAYTAQSLLQCQHCGRRFLEEKLPVHQRSCTAERPAAVVGSHRLKQADAADTAPTPSAPTAITKRPSAVPPSTSKSPLEEFKAADDVDIIVPSRGYDLSQLPSDDGGSGGSAMVACSLCGRHFTSERVARHEAVCTKAQTKPLTRPKTSMPTASTSASNSTSASASSGGGKWKQEHGEFMRSIQYAKKLTQMQKASINIASLPPPPPSSNPDYLQCPHCQRRFNPTAAERHIAACANTINKPKPPPQLRPSTTASLTPTKPTPAAGPAGKTALSRALTKSGMGMKPAGKAVQGEVGGGAGVRAEPAALGSARKAGGDVRAGDLHSQVQQLTATVALLAQQVSGQRGTPAAAGGGLPAIPGVSPRGGGGGGSCRSCAGMLPPAARFCSHCGAAQG